jgi:hypothetical protein
LADIARGQLITSNEGIDDFFGENDLNTTGIEMYVHQQVQHAESAATTGGLDWTLKA